MYTSHLMELKMLAKQYYHQIIPIIQKKITKYFTNFFKYLQCIFSFSLLFQKKKNK